VSLAAWTKPETNGLATFALQKGWSHKRGTTVLPLYLINNYRVLTGQGNPGKSGNLNKYFQGLESRNFDKSYKRSWKK